SSFLLLSFSIILPYLIVDLKLCNRTKQDIPIETDHSLEQLVDDLLKRFDKLLPFYKETKKYTKG
ncbi:hypothetical protein PNB82_13285, partial [Enterococcus faecium]|nr:hypothetical protein [Enterococcus faecium]MDT2800534.1 hypothetical protein [Enterococcus lactis]MDB7375251.1 hypothetical protein [Enterococcus faecium]MDB7382979.1 hypothetical protein [Enterococcus faecium]MDB7398206.1 hypothetical protein [Enterococcus faecium]